MIYSCTLGQIEMIQLNFVNFLQGEFWFLGSRGETCSTCIDFALERLRKTFPDFAHNDRIILLSSQVATRLKKSYYGKSVYSFFDEGQELPFDQYRTPYFFYLDDRLEYKLFFIPDQNQTKVTDFYLNTFKRRFGF
jgi:hypothetical protein